MHPSLKCETLSSLPPGSVIGTSSLRRSAQLKRRFPALKITDIRGNLNTRLSKLDKSDTYSAIILAAAGVIRMGWEHRITEYLDPQEHMFAVGQGSLGIECRKDDADMIRIISSLSDRDSLIRCLCERAFMKKLEGGCSVPIAVNTWFTGRVLHLRGGVYSLDGSECLEAEDDADCDDHRNDHDDDNGEADSLEEHVCIVSPSMTSQLLRRVTSLGENVAEQLLNMGATQILEKVRNAKN